MQNKTKAKNKHLCPVEELENEHLCLMQQSNLTLREAKGQQQSLIPH